MKRLAIAAMLASALGLIVLDAGADGGRKNLGGLASRPSTTSGSAWHGYHHRHGSFFFGGMFFSSWPFGYYAYPPPYYYGPDFSQPQYSAPAMYVEKFEGTPSAATEGEIYCPSASAYYPEVTDCPNGWQRVIR